MTYLSRHFYPSSGKKGHSLKPFNKCFCLLWGFFCLFVFSFLYYDVDLPVHSRGKSSTLYDDSDSTIWGATRSFVFVKGRKHILELCYCYQSEHLVERLWSASFGTSRCSGHLLHLTTWSGNSGDGTGSPATYPYVILLLLARETEWPSSRYHQEFQVTWLPLSLQD